MSTLEAGADAPTSLQSVSTDHAPEDIDAAEAAEMEKAFESVTKGRSLRALPPASGEELELSDSDGFAGDTTAASSEEDTETSSATAETTEPVEEPAPASEDPATTTDEVTILRQRIDELSQQLGKSRDTSAGQIGGVIRELRALQASMADRPTLNLDALQEEYPDLATLLRTPAKAHATPAALPDPTATVPTPSAPEPAEQTAEQRYVDEQARVLDVMQPDWESVVRSPAFSAWLSQQPPALQAAVQQTHSAEVLGAALTQYRAASGTPGVAHGGTRQQAMARGQTPRGRAGASPPLTETSAFEDGFKEIMSENTGRPLRRSPGR